MQPDLPQNVLIPEYICPLQIIIQELAKSTIVNLMLQHIQIFLLRAQLGPILSYIIHSEVA